MQSKVSTLKSRGFETNKKAQQEIEKALYYQYDIFPQIFPGEADGLRTVKMNKINYYYLNTRSTAEILWNHQTILECAKKTYLHDFDSLKFSNKLYKRVIQVKIPYLLISGKSEQILDFHFKEQEQTETEMLRRNKESTLEFFVIHHCHSDAQSGIKWLHFIERYSFKKDHFEYFMTASTRAEDTYLMKNEKLFKELQIKIKLKDNHKIFEGLLLQHQFQLKSAIKIQTDPAFSSEHRVFNRIKPENLTLYYTLQKQFPEQTQSLICRYLIAKQYNLSETRTALHQYIAWREDITSKWKYQDFEEFHQAKIFTYLGQDRMGRPVIINKACNVKVNQFDPEKYSLFYIYFLEIYIPTKMKGHVSQILIIADVEGIGMDNFKFSITRRNMDDSVKYSPERQYKIIGINVGSFALYCWRLMKPLLPKRSVNKIMIAGSDKESIYQTLNQEMDSEVIPDYLGGGNILQ